jgi:hypothetical protein
MQERYDLDRMLEEIREDEGGSPSPERKMSQAEIQAMILQRKKAKRGSGNAEQQ